METSFIRDFRFVNINCYDPLLLLLLLFLQNTNLCSRRAVTVQLPHTALIKSIRLAWWFLLHYLNRSSALSTALHHGVIHCDSVLVHTPAHVLPALLRHVGTELIALGLERWQRDLSQTFSFLLALSQRCWGKTTLILTLKLCDYLI